MQVDPKSEVLAAMMNPPFDGSDPCPACPIEVRGLHATAHNAVGAVESAIAGDGDWTRARRKLAELKDAVKRFDPLMEAHFDDPMHSHGRVQQ